MPVTTESEIREACAFNEALNERLPGSLRSLRASRPLEQILEEVRQSAALPLEEARTLPREAYTSEAFFGWEVENVFEKEWICLAHASQLPEAGDFLNVDLLGEPLLVVRDKSGGVRVLSRSCPHRGMDIMPPGFGHAGHGPAEVRDGVAGCGHTRLLLCPYHSWTFELDGRLKACPEMQEARGFRRDDWGLREFRSEVWHGFIFVNLSGEAPESVAEQYAGIAEHIAKWNLADMEVVAAKEWDTPCNWKVLTENFMESYHHAGAHSKTLQRLMPAKQTWTEEEKPHHIRCHLPYHDALRAEILAKEAAGERWGAFPVIEGLTEDERFEWGLFLGYPLFAFVVLADQAVWYRIFPVSPGRIQLVTTVLVPRETTRHPDFDSMLERGAAEALAFHLEDLEMITAVQRSYYANGYQRGRISHLEMPVWLIQRYLAARARGTWPTLDHPPAPAQR